MNRLEHERYRLDVVEQEPDAACARGCGRDCEHCRGEVEPGPDEGDLLTRGLLDSFSSFIATGGPQRHDGDDDQEFPGVTDTPQASAMDMALGRMEAALGALASAMPELASRLSSVEARVDEVESVEWVQADPQETDVLDADRDALAGSLKDKLSTIRRECDRLSDGPIERVEARVDAAERTLGALVERAEAAARACEAERRAAEGACDRLESLATALSPWVELLELRQTEDGLPKPMAALLRLAGQAMAHELSSVRGSMDRVAAVLGATEPEAAPAGEAAGVLAAPDTAQVERPMDPSEPDGHKPERRKGRPARAVRAKGADAETPRRTASQKRLAAEARLRARTRAEGRPPRR